MICDSGVARFANYNRLPVVARGLQSNTKPFEPRARLWYAPSFFSEVEPLVVSLGWLKAGVAELPMHKTPHIGVLLLPLGFGASDSMPAGMINTQQHRFVRPSDGLKTRRHLKRHPGGGTRGSLMPWMSSVAG